MHDPILSRARTRTDRKLKLHFAMTFLIFAVGIAGLGVGADLLPAAWRPYVVPPVVIIFLVIFYGLFLVRRADASNRVTRSADEAHERIRRASILGGGDSAR